jgi:methylase of polypeptide subunit release factors
MTEITGLFDLIISNPPYLVDKSRRLYRHGGGAWGCNLGLRIVQEGLTKLGPGGKLLLYTGTPIVEGKTFSTKQYTLFCEHTVRPLNTRK